MSAMKLLVEAIREDPVLLGAALDTAILHEVDVRNCADSYVLRLRSLRVLVDAAIDEILRPQTLVAKLKEVLS